MEPAYLYGFEKYSKEFNILNENPVICKRIEDIILKTKKDYHNHIVEILEKERQTWAKESIGEIAVKSIMARLQDTNPKE